MRFDEIGARDTIAVGEDEIIATCLGNSLVKDGRLAKALVGLPDMFDQTSGRRAQIADRLARLVT